MLTYSEHYKKCKIVAGYPEPRLDLYEFDYRIIAPNEKTENTLVTFPENYDEIVEAAARKYSQLMEDPLNINVPRDPSIDFAVRLQTIHGFSEFENLAQVIIPQIERNLFGCHVVMEGMYAYTNVHRAAPPRASWNWHYDNNPREIIKIMVYLSDVGEDSGAFEILQNDKEETVKMPTYKIDYTQWTSAPSGSRMNESDLNSMHKSGFRGHKILGKKGTVVVFDNNILHRASIPEPNNSRDAIVFMIRPWLKKEDVYINEQHCRAWTRQSIFENPEDI